MTPDREAALRDLLTAIRDGLDVPSPASPADWHEVYRARDLRAQIVRSALKGLIEGPLDNTAVQTAGRVLTTCTAGVETTYATAAAP